jgi:hypothetical protein
MDKYSLYCGLGNILSFVILYAICIIMVVNYVSNIIAVILLILLFFPICGYFEEKILSRFINLMIEKLFGE